MTKPLRTLLALTLAATLASPAAADVLLGSRVVADHSETDIIQAPGNARYGSVRVCVAHRAVHFRDLDIVFQNGGRQDAAIRALIGPGGCTRWIDLNGPRRNINRVVLRYDALINAGTQPVVSAYAR